MNFGIADQLAFYLGPYLAHQTRLPLDANTPRRETLTPHAGFHRQANRWAVQPPCLGGRRRGGRASPPARASMPRRHFAITTDINKLISPDLDWRQREIAYEKAFPGSFGSILVVVDAPTPELVGRGRRAAGAAAVRAAQAVSIGAAARWRSVLRQERPAVSAGGRSGAHDARGSAAPAPIIGALAGDPSLRGLTRALSLRSARRAERPGQARGSHARADHVGGHDRPGAGRTAGELFLARAADRADRRKASDLRHFIEVRAGAGLHRAAARPGAERRHPARRRPTSSSERIIRRASA